MGVFMDLLDFGPKLCYGLAYSFLKHKMVGKKMGAQFGSATAGSADRAESFKCIMSPVECDDARAFNL